MTKVTCPLCDEQVTSLTSRHGVPMCETCLEMAMEAQLKAEMEMDKAQLEADEKFEILNQSFNEA